jgi:hypothetical protein
MDQIKKKSEKGVETTFHDNMGLVEESGIGKYQLQCVLV